MSRKSWSGKQLGKYRLLSRLGEGGMGVVWEAEDSTLGRRVALKILSEDVAGNPDALQRFQREARAAAALNHPHAVQIHEIGECEGAHYLALELMPGGNVSRLLAGGVPLPWRQATKLIADACRGLAAAHAAGLLHRDIKPGNILLTADGVAKLADFGIAKFRQQTDSLTPTGNTIGTPDYMSPEQCRNEELDGRGDIYSLGVTYFVLLTGKPPFAADTPLQTMFAHCSTPAPDPCGLNAAIPAPCARIVARTLQKNRSDRPGSAAALVVELEKLLDLPDDSEGEPNDALSATHRLRPIRLRRPGSLVTVAGLLLLAVLAGLTWRLLAGDSAGGTDDSTPAVPNPADKPPPVSRKPRPFNLRFRAKLEGHEGDVQTIAVSPDGKQFASGDFLGNIRLWKLPGGEFLRPLKGHRAKVNTLAYSPDGQMLLSGSDDVTLRFWDPETGMERRNEPVPTGIMDLRFSPNGKLLLAAAGRGGVRLWKFQAPDRLEPIYERAFGGLLVRAVFSPDGTRCAAIDFLKGVVVLGTETDETLASLREGEQFTCLAYSPDGASIALGQLNGRLLSWRPPEGIPTLLSDLSQFRTCLVWSPDGGSIVFGNSWDSNPRIWRAANKKLVSADGSRARLSVNALAFAGEETLITGHIGDGTIQLWDAVPEPSP